MKGYEIIKQAKGLYNPGFEKDSCGVGFVVNVKGEKSHAIIKQGLEILKRLAHRGAVGADPKTGDGAGILIQIPHEYYSAKIKLPLSGAYGTGLVFLPKEQKLRQICKDIFNKIIEENGQVLVGWREIQVDDADIGVTAKNSAPAIEQVFIAKGQKVNTQLDLEKRLYAIRRSAEKQIKYLGFYINSLSSRTIIYKGLLMPDQVEKYYPELLDEKMKSAIALVHSRYSTNTFPTWHLAQPFRYLAHNGEINTLAGNTNWMAARGMDVILENGSDSSALDNVLELLVLSGRSLAHSMMMLIPPAWEHNQLMTKELKDFYRFHACFMEAWDGPASVAFTDGIQVGAMLDRNGLRPARYIVTKDDLVIMASEVGVLDIAPENIAYSGRLLPGKMFFIDTKQGRIIEDEELKQQIASCYPYGEWLDQNMVELDSLHKVGITEELNQDLMVYLNNFGYSREDLRTIIKPMAEKAKEPVGSMGNDTPHAVLSKKPQLLFNYFKQLFAQVTNPPIDPIREEVVMSMETFLGPQGNILEPGPLHCHKLRVKEPILTNEELERIRNIQKNSFRAKTIPLLYSVDKEKDLPNAVTRICSEAETAVLQGYSFLILSDRNIDKKNAALPSLLAIGAIHHYLIKKALRTKVGIIIESAEPREVHHFALLFGYGADLVNPYLAYEAIQYLVQEKEICLDAKTAINNYRFAVNHGILKILSKMGISTLSSYRGAQIFEALGLAPEVIDQCFCNTVSRINGTNFSIIAKETGLRHEQAFNINSEVLLSGGLYQWKKDGEFHLWNPDSIAALQDATRNNDPEKFKIFSKMINDQSVQPTTLRSLLKFKETNPISIDQVESVQSIVTRFAVGAMSFGSISGPAHENIAIAMNRLKGKSNTGEGGEDPRRFIPLDNGDSKRSAIKQVASGRFGVTTNYLVNADEIQIKIAQGAKPGEGGQLPGHKVSVTIASTRYTTPGVTLISPPPHHDIYSIEDLAQLIFDLKNVNPQARISVKLVSEAGVGTVAAGVAKGHADMILISGGDGGTGASPLSSIKHAGLPWELGLAETHQTLVLNNLRSRVKLQTDGQLRTGRDIALAAILGAEEFGFATAVLIVSGCVMLRHCHLNNCSLGVATQDELLAKRYSGKPDHIVNYFNFVAQELREIMAELGVKKLEELIGRTDLLELNSAILPWKAKDLDLSKLLCGMEGEKNYCTIKQDHALDQVLDKQLIALAKPAIENRQKVKGELVIKNNNRSTGAMLSGEVVKACGESGLAQDTINFKFHGVAGQSFGAWLAKGITLTLEGLANDYVGKGISGGKIIVFPYRTVSYEAEKNIIVGNTCFYGAISGEAYIRGIAGERFCIRNSGLHAVVEGVGDHGCEYMTGGRVVILGETGRNFGAGMSGGIAYIYDKNNSFKEKCNLSMVELKSLGPEDKVSVLQQLQDHYRYTASSIAKKIIDNFSKESRRFVKVLPLEYKRILEENKETDLAEII